MIPSAVEESKYFVAPLLINDPWLLSPGFWCVWGKLLGVELWPQCHNLMHVYQGILSVYWAKIPGISYSSQKGEAVSVALLPQTQNQMWMLLEVWRAIARFALISITCHQPSHCWERQNGYYLHPVDLTAFFRSTFLISLGQNSLMMWRVRGVLFLGSTNQNRQERVWTRRLGNELSWALPCFLLNWAFR